MVGLVLLICIFALLIIIGVATTNNTTYAPINYAQCEHDFVVSSKYDMWRSGYKTISKCYKCGLEI